jgi:cyanoexosortase B
MQSIKKKWLITPYFEYLTIALLTIIYLPLLLHWYDGWLHKTISIEHEYFSHGMIGLPFAFHISWLKRKQWHKLIDTNNYLGAILLVFGIFLYLTGVGELVNFSLPIALVGICLWLKGVSGLKLQTFPLLLLLLATPNSLPYLITPFTLPLQKFIAIAAGFILLQFNLDVSVEQIYIAVEGNIVEVAPYCAGLKMLFTSSYVALMLLYWTGKIRDRVSVILLLISSIVISIVANIIRNTMLAFFHGTNQEQLFVWLHDSWGGDLYSALMLASILLTLNLIEKFDTQGKN